METSTDSTLEKLQREWLSLKEKGRVVQDEFYASDFAPAFIPYFVQLDLKAAPAEFQRPKFLISVLGLSWQPVALMAAWCQPEHCLILGTSDSFLQPKGSSEKPLERISRLAQLPLSNIEWHEVDDNEEWEIYRAVKEFLRKYRVGPREAALDITGGKKSMSSSAALAGFLTGCPIVYVDYAEYVERIPLAGTEFPRLLSNPLEIFGDVEMENIKSAFSRGDFGEAERRSSELAGRLYSPRKAELFARLSRAYGEWSGFRFSSAASAMNEARATLQQFKHQQRWDWALSLTDTLEKHEALLLQMDALSEKPASVEDAICIILNHLASAKRVWQEGRLSIAILLLYSTLEKYFDLLLWVKFGLDDDSPNYGLIKDKLDLEQFHELGSEIFKGSYERREPAGKLMLGNSMHLVATLLPSVLPLELLKGVQGFLQARNKCEFEHGFKAKAITSKDIQKWFDFVCSVLSLHFGPGPDGRAALEDELKKFQFPVLTF